MAVYTKETQAVYLMKNKDDLNKIFLFQFCHKEVLQNLDQNNLMRKLKKFSICIRNVWITFDMYYFSLNRNK